eukprot:13667831-Heterocapsa_arctica.AAC.1
MCIRDRQIPLAATIRTAMPGALKEIFLPSLRRRSRMLSRFTSAGQGSHRQKCARKAIAAS